MCQFRYLEKREPLLHWWCRCLIPSIRHILLKQLISLKITKSLCLSILLFAIFQLKATAQPGNPGDRIIKILGGKNFRIIEVDSSTTLTTLAVGAAIQEGNTYISGDSIVINNRTNKAQIFGNVYINDGDTMKTRAEYLEYDAGKQVAYLKRNVTLTDGQGTLYANDVMYDISTGIASYKNGGRVVSKNNVLTSTNAVYYSDTKDVYFKEKVRLVAPEHNIKTDSLKFNVQTSIAQFITETEIKTKNGTTIYTRDGFYNLKNGRADLRSRSSIRDKNMSVEGDNITSDDQTGIAQVEGNAKIVDSINKVIVLSNLAVYDKKKNAFLATRKPVMIFYKDNDSTYITGDTLFSGMNIVKKQQDIIRNTTAKNIKESTSDSIRYFIAYHHVKIFNDSLQAVADSLHYSTFDSTFKLFQNPVVWNGNSQLSGDTMYLFMENQQPKRINVFYHALLVNRDAKNFFNQIGGKTLNGYFVDGKIDFIRVKGSPAESIYYPLDKDSAYVGMNRCKGDVIDIFFKNEELIKVKFVRDVVGVLYPMSQIPSDQKFLDHFIWLENKRPKHKLELFE